MAITPVGQLGNAVTSAQGSAPLGYNFGQIPTPGNLLICWWAGSGSGTVPTTPTGWTAGSKITSGTAVATLFWDIATGNDPPPVFGSIASDFQTVMLAEFSGASTTPLDQVGSKAFGGGSGTITYALADRGANDLIVTSSSAQYGAPTACTMSHTYNNGGVTNTVYNDASSVQTNHAVFSYAILATHAVGDQVSCVASTPSPTLHAGSSESYFVGANPNTPPLVAGTFVTRRDR